MKYFSMLNEDKHDVLTYKIVTGRSNEELANSVQRALENGWQPQGGVSVTPPCEGDNWYHNLTLYQAMVKLRKDR